MTIWKYLVSRTFFLYFPPSALQSGISRNSPFQPSRSSACFLQFGIPRFLPSCSRNPFAKEFPGWFNIDHTIQKANSQHQRLGSLRYCPPSHTRPCFLPHFSLLIEIDFYLWIFNSPVTLLHSPDRFCSLPKDTKLQLLLLLNYDR